MTTPNDAAPDASRERDALPPEMSEFLIEFAIGVHRHSMYPDNHPSLRPSVERLVRRMVRLFESRGSIEIGIGHDQLIVDGVATDAGHPMLSGLAGRLHEHQLGAMIIEKGVGAGDLEELLGLMGHHPESADRPIGLMAAEELPSWDHIRLHAVGYQRLVLSGSRIDVGASGERAVRIWLELARAALRGSEITEVAGAEPDSVARSIEGRRGDEAWARTILGHLVRLTDALRTGFDEESERVRGQVSTLIRQMDSGALDRLVEMGGDVATRKRFALDANESLAVDAVVKIFESGARASNQAVSPPMAALLTKMAGYSGCAAGSFAARASTALRENVEDLVAEWDLDAVDSRKESRYLDAILTIQPDVDSDRPRGSGGGTVGAPADGPRRVIRTALKVEAFGPTVEAAALDLLEQGLGAELFRILRDHSGSGAEGRIMAYLTEPERVGEVLGSEGLDDAGLNDVVADLGDAAIDPLLDVLARSESRLVRHRILHALVTLGEPFVGLIRERLRGEERWYVLRNLLSLLVDIPGGSAEPPRRVHLEHPDARVRREAVRLALRSPDGAARERVVASALSDPDDRVVRLALVEMNEGVPSSVVPSLINRVVVADRDDELRVLGIRMLRGTDSALVREALVELCIHGTSIFGTPRLADAGPVTIAALRALATTWPEHEEVGPILKQARLDRDPVLRRAAEAP